MSLLFVWIRWLGLLTAGCVWTSFWKDEGTEPEFSQNIAAVLSEIKRRAPTYTTESGSSAPVAAAARRPDPSGRAVVVEEQEFEDLFTLDEMRAELERLREEAAPVRKVIRNLDGPCILPAAVPALPPGMRATDDLQRLVAAVVSPRSKLRVGFCGMGGMGKTTASAWLCRQDEVREHFDSMLWVALGQQPNLQTSLDLMYQQLTGSELNPQFNNDRRQEATKQAMAGKKILLCLDDVWIASHAAELIFLDPSTASRALISSRVRNTLGDCEIVDVGLPSEDDALDIVMSAAGMPAGAKEPTGARELVAICKRLPLTLGIAGRIAKEMGMGSQDDWNEVIELCREELQGTDHTQNEVGRMIVTSLRSIQGPHAETTRTLLTALGLVPEDVSCPLDVLAWLYEAVVNDPGSPVPTISQLRRMVKCLIDRSVVLGPVDMPSLHGKLAANPCSTRSGS